MKSEAVPIEEVIVLVVNKNHPNKGELGDVLRASNNSLIVKLAGGKKLDINQSNMDDIDLFYRSKKEDINPSYPTSFENLVVQYCEINKISYNIGKRLFEDTLIYYKLTH